MIALVSLADRGSILVIVPTMPARVNSAPQAPIDAPGADFVYFKRVASTSAPEEAP
jgi:hypothetical protein